jgi:predicted HTH domain antitoxin
MEKDLEYAAKFIAFQKAVEERGKQVFILAYKKCNFSITKAAEMIGICRDKHYEWLKDEKYAEQFRNAHDQMGDILEAEGYRRAVEGWDEPVWNKDGFLCGYIRKYSDSLLLKMLPANKERYKEKQTEVNIHNNVNVQLADAMDAARERLINANIQNRIGTSQ